VAVGAKNEYADVIGQVGGPYVRVRAVMSNPDTDPHTFEASPSVARQIGAARAGRAERRGLRHVHEHHRERRGQPSKIPVVGVYETMPVPGYHYQSWMLAEMRGLQLAVADKVSTEHL
jgi:ABC-type Zn uptake system ZnuABC Zn-binding protein ZnuA